MVAQKLLSALARIVAVVGFLVLASASALTPSTSQYWVVTPAGGYATIEACRNACNKTGGSCSRVGWVATVKNEYEQRLLYAAVKASSSTGALLGASRSPSNRSQFLWTEGPLQGTVFWVGLTRASGGHGVEYNNFAHIEPNDSGSNEDSLQINTNVYAGGEWNDIHTPSSSMNCSCQTFSSSTVSCTNEMSMSSSISEELSSSAAVTSAALSASTSTTLSLSRSLLSHLSSVTSTPGVSLTPSAESFTLFFSFTYTSTLSISPSSSNSLISSSSFTTESSSRTYPSRVSLSSSHSQESRSPSSSRSLSSYSITRPSYSNSLSNTSTASSSSPRSLTHDSLSVSSSLTIPVIPLLKHLDVRDTQTTVAALSVVSVGTGGGDLSAAASMVLLSVASCSSSSSSSAQSTAPSLTRYLISPFWAFGSVWTAVGNLMLVIVVCGMQAVVIGIASIVTRTSFSELATGKGRFPAMAVMVADYFLPGAVMGAVLTLAEGADGVVGRGVCVAVLVCCCVYVVAAILFVHLVLAPRSSWVLYCSYPTTAARVWDTLLYPAGRWAPKAIRNAFGPVLGPVTRRWTALGSIERIVSVLIAAICGLEGNAACRPLLLIVAVLCFIRSAVFTAMRPLRLPMNAVVVPVTSAVFGTVCVLKYVAPSRGGGSTDDVAVESAVRLLQIFQAVLQVWRVWWEMWIAYREAQWDIACFTTVGGETSLNVATAMATAVWFGGGGASRDVIAAFLSSSLGDEDGDEVVEQPRTIAAASTMTSLLRREGDDEDVHELELVPMHIGNHLHDDVFFDDTWARRDDKKEARHEADSKMFAGIEDYFLV